jgi:putative transposase
MRQEGLRGVQRCRTPRTTRPDQTAADRAEDLVNRDFTAERPNQVSIQPGWMTVQRMPQSAST